MEVSTPQPTPFDQRGHLHHTNSAAFVDAGSASFMHDDANNEDGDFDPSMSMYMRPSTVDLRMSSILKLPTMHLRGPVFHGWLWKKGASFKTWKKRFFLLNGCTLTYYTQSCIVETEVGTRCFELPAKGGLRVASAELTDATEFGIRITSSSGRVLYVQAGDRASRTKWLGVLMEAPKKKLSESTIRCTSVSDFTGLQSFTQSMSSQTSENSVQSSSASSTMSSEEEEEDVGITDMSGWLHIRRRGALLKAYKKRYVTLLDGHLTITSNKRERRPSDRAHEVISVTSWNGHECGLRIQLGHHKDLYVYASSNEELTRWLKALQNNL